MGEGERGRGRGDEDLDGQVLGRVCLDLKV